MSVESANYINQLNTAYPRTDDLISEGDDHIRLVKRTLIQTFPAITGPVNVSDSQLNAMGNAFTNDSGTMVVNMPIRMGQGKSMSAGGNRVTNFGNAVDDGDGVSKGYGDKRYALQSFTIAGKPLSGNISLINSDVGLGNVPNLVTTEQATVNTIVKRDSAGKSQFVDVYITSDKRLKSNFEQIEKPLEAVEALNGFIYDKDNGQSVEREVGVIAQEVAAVLPHSVKEIDGILHVSHAGVIALLVEAVKELSAEVKALKGE